MFFTDGEFLLLWADDKLVKEEFVHAFESMAVAPDEKRFWSEMHGGNAFKLNLYRYLLPDCRVDFGTIRLTEHIGNLARVTVPLPEQTGLNLSDVNSVEKFPVCELRLKKR